MPNPSPPPARSAETAPKLRAGRSPRAIMVFMLVVLAVLVADLALKSWAFANVAGEPVVLEPELGERGMQIPYHEATELAPYVLALQLTLNRGAVFGMGQGQIGLFVIMSLLAVGVIGWMFYRSRPGAWGTHLVMALILAGALGNLYDRIFYGAVRDMLKLFPEVLLPFGLAWPGGSREVYPWIFNLADVALVLGVIGVMVATWRADSTRVS